MHIRTRQITRLDTIQYKKFGFGLNTDEASNPIEWDFGQSDRIVNKKKKIILDYYLGDREITQLNPIQ